MDATTTVITELSKASPYAVLLVLGFFLFYNMHKNAVAEIKDLSRHSIDQIRQAYKDSHK